VARVAGLRLLTASSPLRREAQMPMHTPHIQRLADTGVVFDRAYVQIAVCSPSRRGLLTFSITIQSPCNLQSTKDGPSSSIILFGRAANSWGGGGGAPATLAW
jgi:hypothetical protein